MCQVSDPFSVTVVSPLPPLVSLVVPVVPVVSVSPDSEVPVVEPDGVSVLLVPELFPSAGC